MPYVWNMGLKWEVSHREGFFVYSGFKKDKFYRFIEWGSSRTGSFQESDPLRPFALPWILLHCFKVPGDRNLLSTKGCGNSLQADPPVGQLILATSTAPTNMNFPPSCPSPPVSHVSLWRRVSEDAICKEQHILMAWTAIFYDWWQVMFSLSSALGVHSNNSIQKKQMLKRQFTGCHFSELHQTSNPAHMACPFILQYALFFSLHRSISTFTRFFCIIVTQQFVYFSNLTHCSGIYLHCY